MKRQMFRIAAALLMVIAMMSMSSDSAQAITGRVRTSDWRFIAQSATTVIYLSDYDGTYGTLNPSIAVGL